MRREEKIEKKITELLQNDAFFNTVFCYDEVTSTNELAKQELLSKAKEGTVFLALGQSEGKGRLGRRFFSPDNVGVYMSIVLRLGDKGLHPGLLTASGAVAVCRVLKKLCKVEPEIKWVNDIYVHDKKLCGILAEGIFTSSGVLQGAVIGIGLNLKKPLLGYPEEISDIAISLEELVGTDNLPTYEEICSELIAAFSELYKIFPDTEFLKEYKAASCVLGKQITYVKENATHKATALDIDNEAGLVVKNESGDILTLSTGEIQLLRRI